MSTTLLPPGQWAQCEFGFAQLGDQRRNQRLVNIAEHLAARPGGTLPQAFPDWAELKAAYRFFGQRGVSFERVLAPHLERTRQACRQPGEYLLIEDTTLLDYSGHGHTAELGLIGDGGRGFELHSALAVRVEAWTLAQRPEGTVVGLFDQKCRRPRPAPAGETRHERLSRPRKSQTWAAGIKTAGRPPAGSQWIYVADRESDFYEPLQICQQHGVELVIRACQDRRLADPAGRLKAALAQAPVLGETTVAVRGRGSQAARQAVVAMRSVRVDLDGPWRPGGWQAPLRDLGAVEVSEMHAAEGVKEPLHWILLTSLPCITWSQVQRVVGCYTARWWIEEYHKALKSGTGVEQKPVDASGSPGAIDCGAGRGGRASAQHQNAGAEPAGVVRGRGEFRFGDVKPIGQQTRPAQGRVDQSESHPVTGTFGWIYRPQARWRTGLANDLARLATADVDARRSRNSPTNMKKMWVRTRALALGCCAQSSIPVP